MSERIHAFGENGELSAGAELALQQFMEGTVNPAIGSALSGIGTSALGVPVFGSQAEALAWEAANPGKVALWFDGGTEPEPGTDTTAPTLGLLASSAIGMDTFTLTVTGATDNVALHAQPYAFSTDAGSTWSAWQASNAWTATGRAASTTYPCRHRVRDAAGNISTRATSLDVTTNATAGVHVTATEPTWIDDVFNGGGTWTSPSIAGLTYTPAAGTATPGQAVTVNVTAATGYVNDGPSSFSHTFPVAPDSPVVYRGAHYVSAGGNTANLVFLDAVQSASTDRLVIALIHSRTMSSQLGNVTFAGIPATTALTNISEGGAYIGTAIAWAVVPAATTGDVLVDIGNNNTYGSTISLWEAPATATVTTNRSKNQSQGTATVQTYSAISTVAGDVILGISAGLLSGTAPTPSWSSELSEIDRPDFGNSTRLSVAQGEATGATIQPSVTWTAAAPDSWIINVVGVRL